jgi:hypothetical protein
LSLRVAVAVSWLVCPSPVSCPLPLIATLVTVIADGGVGDGGVGVVGDEGWLPQLTHTSAQSAIGRRHVLWVEYCMV